MTGIERQRPMPAALHVYERQVPTDRGGFTLAEDDAYFYDAIKMMFNWRLVMTPKSDLRIWDYGWCYESPTTLTLALRAWDPRTQNEPLGFKKRPTPQARRAPHGDQDPHYNRPRCAHGQYIDDGPCPAVLVCADPRRVRNASSTL
jgi:hypothetical protein